MWTPDDCSNELLVCFIAGCCLGMCIGVLLFMDSDDDPPTNGCSYL